MIDFSYLNSIGGPSFKELLDYQNYSYYEFWLSAIYINSVFCLLDFAQVFISGSEGSHSYGR